MSWIPVAGFFILLAGFIYELYTGSIRSRFYKPDLKFDVKSCGFYNDIHYNQSGLDYTIFMTNKGNKITTILNIIYKANSPLFKNASTAILHLCSGG